MEKHNINRYLVKDIESRLRISNLFSWIDEEGERLAQHGLVTNCGVEFTDALKRERNITGIVVGDVLGEDASIHPDRDGYAIYYKRGLPENRIRFAIAHEIGHTYWFAPGGGGKPLSPIQWNVGSDPNIESLCDRFAGALLLPRLQLLRSLENFCNLDDLSIPPLHAIPLLAKEYRVAEQAVARRIFFNLFPSKLVLLCIRLLKGSETLFGPEYQQDDRWELAWCSLPAELQQQELVSGFRIPLRTSGRTIPKDMLPNEIEDGTKVYRLDGRWWYGIQGQPDKIARTPFKRVPLKASKEGYIARHGDYFYVALPL